MLKLKAHQARAAQKRNPYATWAARSKQANADEPRHASNRVWREKLEIGITPKFTLSRQDKVFAIGSCFAREVEDALVASGFDVPTHCDKLFQHPLLRRDDQQGGAYTGMRPRSYLNRYNTMSMLAEVKHILGMAPAIEQGQLSYPINETAAADLHYSQSLPQVSLEKTVKRRGIIRDYLQSIIGECSVFVITLGLAEAWYDTSSASYLNNTPGPRVLAAYGDHFEIHLTDFLQHLQALEDIRETLTASLGDRLRLIVTVSPVPLEKTFFPQDVITTNLYSKSMLRAVAQEFAAIHENVDYFPSYEIVMLSDQDAAWGWDRRHVTPHLVRYITGLFREHYVC